MSLARFLTAQAPIYDTVLAELRAGRKRSHWMWFVFPQLKALGRSPTAKFYGIADLDEARAYLAHPVLGPRLTERVRAGRRVRPARVTSRRSHPERRTLHRDRSEDDVEQRDQQEHGQEDELHHRAAALPVGWRHGGGSASAWPVACTVGPTGRNHASSGSRAVTSTVMTG